MQAMPPTTARPDDSSQRTQPMRWRIAHVGGALMAESLQRADGSWLLRSTEPLQPFPQRITDALEHWAELAPTRTFVARRAPGPEPAERRPWQSISYAQMLERVRRVGQALALRVADGELSAERPIVILSGNDLQHLTLALAACWVGVPFAPISPAYSTIAQDLGRLEHIIDLLTPGMVFAHAWEPFERAIEGVVPRRTELVLTDPTGLPPEREATRFSTLLESAPGAALEVAHGKVEPETIAKILFTSGSTKKPKGVATTHRMWCANLQQIRQCFAFLADEPPVLVDWLPWNHVFGGNHNVGIALYNGGTLYIDDGKPTPAGLAETIANLREVSPTVYFNVPKGFEELARAMESDEALRRGLLLKVRAFMYAGAGLSQSVWEQLDRLAEKTAGERIPIFTGLGMTETSPSCTFALGRDVRAGDIGLPAPGVEVKVVADERTHGKHEIRFRGPNVMSEYWRSLEDTMAAFDEEGFYRTGDAVRLRNPDDPAQGLVFDGRIAEDFKLATGTFVSVGPLRAAALLSGHPLVHDVVVTGVDRDEVGFLVFPHLDEMRMMAGADKSEPPELTIAHPKVRGFIRNWLKAMHEAGTGSSNRPTRALLLTEPPSLDRGELTDKGSINQRAVLHHRAAAVERLYADVPDAAVIRVVHAQ
jgi:feruloyl-CoA synthase